MAGNCCGSNEVETVFTRDRVKLVQKRVPAHARARVHKYLTVFWGIYFWEGTTKSARASRILIFPTRLSSRNAGALSDVSMQT